MRCTSRRCPRTTPSSSGRTVCWGATPSVSACRPISTPVRSLTRPLAHAKAPVNARTLAGRHDHPERLALRGKTCYHRGDLLCDEESTCAAVVQPDSGTPLCPFLERTRMRLIFVSQARNGCKTPDDSRISHNRPVSEIGVIRFFLAPVTSVAYFRRESSRRLPRWSMTQPFACYIPSGCVRGRRTRSSPSGRARSSAVT